MSRHLTREEQERSLYWGQERDRLALSLRDASVAEQIQAYKQFEKRRLKEAGTAFERREVRRRTAEALVMTTREGPWRLFSPYLRRLEKLGYSTMDRRLFACVMAAMASKGSPTGRRKTAELIADIERRTRGRKYHPALRWEIDHSLARARMFAGLDTEESAAEGRRRRKKTASRGRRSAK
jgi:hypothetical protein